MVKSKYGRISVEGKDIPEGEPLFLLRGQDRLAVAAVRYYASLVSATGDSTSAREIMKCADDMEKWPKKKYPD